MQVAGLQFTVDAKLVDQAAHRVYRFQAQPPQRFGVLKANQFFQCVLVGALAGAHVPPVAARGAPADAVGFQQHHRVAAFAQVNGTRQAGIAAAHDAHIRGGLAAQRLEV